MMSGRYCRRFRSGSRLGQGRVGRATPRLLKIVRTGLLERGKKKSSPRSRSRTVKSRRRGTICRRSELTVTGVTAPPVCRRTRFKILFKGLPRLAKLRRSFHAAKGMTFSCWKAMPMITSRKRPVGRGGKIIVYPHARVPLLCRRRTSSSATWALYGATQGEAYIRRHGGRAVVASAQQRASTPWWKPSAITVANMHDRRAGGGAGTHRTQFLPPACQAGSPTCWMKRAILPSTAIILQMVALEKLEDAGAKSRKSGPDDPAACVANTIPQPARRQGAGSLGANGSQDGQGHAQGLQTDAPGHCQSRTGGPERR